jgi:eukaryotic-like serine/threonine-protein kinase
MLPEPQGAHWSKDGRYLIAETQDNPKTQDDIWMLPLFGDRKPIPYLHTEASERLAKLSPNGKWLAYMSDESKRYEVYVQTFPNPGGKWQVSVNGGGKPVWSRDAKELYFIGADKKMMAVEVKGGDQFEAGVPRPLFDTQIRVFQRIMMFTTRPNAPN